MVEEFVDNLNEAELEYTEVVRGSLGNTASAKLMEVFLRLTIRVSDLCIAGNEPNMLIIDLAINEWKAMQLGDLMGEISRTS